MRYQIALKAPLTAYLFTLHPRNKGAQGRTFDEVAALARLAHKYHVQDIEDEALDLLRQPYTDSFDEWVAGKKPESISVERVHAIGAVNVARLTGMTSMLPIALYYCCNLGSNLLDGWKREDGHIEHLSVDDLKRCFTARETLCKTGAQIFLKIFHDQPSATCLNVEKCRTALSEMTQSRVKFHLPTAVECRVLRSWKRVIDADSLTYGICIMCKMDLFARDEEARREVWDKLPDIFGVSVPK